MKKIILLLAGITIPAFLLPTPVYSQPSDNCAQETLESNITDNLPDPLLIATLQGRTLNEFFEKLRGFGLMGGTLPIDKIYIFTSEHHPDMLYVYFLKEGCIQDVRLTLKTLVVAALEN